MNRPDLCSEHLFQCFGQECIICPKCKICIRKCDHAPHPYQKVFDKKVYEEYFDLPETDQEANEQKPIPLNKMLRDQVRPHKGWVVKKNESGLYQAVPALLRIPLVKTSWQMTSIVIQYSSLKGSAKLVAATIATYYNKNWGVCYPSYTKLMDDTGFSRSTISSAIAEMKTSGEWLIGQRSGRRYNHYIPYLGICTIPSAASKAPALWCPPPCTFKYGGAAAEESRKKLAKELNDAEDPFFQIDNVP